MVHADGVRGVLDVFREARVLEVVGAVAPPGRQRQRDVVEHLQCDRVEEPPWNDVAGERILLEPAAADGPPRERVVDLILGPERQQLGEVAGAHLRRRDRRRAVVARARFVDPLEAVQEEGPRPPVISRQHHRSPGRSAISVVVEIRERDVVRVGEEVVREEIPRRLVEVDRAAKRVGPRLGAQVRHAPLGVAEGGVERGGLDLEFLQRVGRRHVGRDHFAGVCRRRARHAVDGQVAPVAARAVHRVADDVRGLEGAVEPRRAGVRHAIGEADERVGIAVRCR